MRTLELAKRIRRESDAKIMYLVGRILEPELVPVDRILQRWAVAIGNGLPTEEWDDRRRSLPPPLDDDLAVIVDQAVLRSPSRTKQVIFAWYKTPVPVRQLARKLKLSPDNLYVAWRLSLHFMRHRLESTGNQSLAKLLSFDYADFR